MSGFIPNRRIYVEDVITKDGDIDPEKLLYVVNIFMEAAYNLFDKNIEIREHLNADIVTQQFTTSIGYTATQLFTPLKFKQSLKKRTEGLVLINIVNNTNRNKLFTTPVTIDWVEDKDDIRINYVTGLEDDTAYTLTLLVL